ncbi:MAG TPA: UDP-2,3-diacylglucosamine diphosphatase, partial [Burkholderiaceae bacterium]|nr:UDP-2,3-diacylglucosamine diphosphatase [Burkholderiaceae bacterium]
MVDSAPRRPVPAQAATLDRLWLRDPIFISDLHLCAHRARTLQRFFDLLQDIAGRAAELVILGDLFEYWAGDDTLLSSARASAATEGADDDLVGQRVAQALRRLSERGTAVYLMQGNRDVLLGTEFLEQSGARLLADPTVASIDTCGAPDQAVLTTLLSHGDAYCTLDLPYQAFRRQARNAQFQGMFLSQPLAQRRKLIGQARERSEASKQQTSTQIMDVTPAAIDEALRSAGVRHMIHGHTHR